MSQIKSLAQQLKHKLEEQKGVPIIDDAEKTPVQKERQQPEDKESAREAKKIAAFLSALREFNMDGQEKILIRLDKRTIAQLKQLKVATNIEMIRVIAFALQNFLKSNPWLNDYISEKLKQMSHELD
ncbi:hypothetical protein ASU31_00155 [Pedobacter ginsenosidimutans]|uniref:Uncharacterized protein n=1 Tax=Pedobacter ginsenosidimutans TaxID=687842 RepID=A0A0T5VVA9_9SPHI|nr:hypothetical protein [Pedobacter ginsenosidimutans]KRT17746.1 hypothetical protein ASU31_00155 [Pedobacter ginsenosidimutans]